VKSEERTKDLWNTRREIQTQNWINRLERMDNTKLPKHALNYKPRGRRDRGRPRTRWQRVDAGTGQTTKSIEGEEEEEEEDDNDDDDHDDSYIKQQYFSKMFMQWNAHYHIHTNTTHVTRNGTNLYIAINTTNYSQYCSLSKP
jgi:hypothetical protein